MLPTPSPAPQGAVVLTPRAPASRSPISCLAKKVGGWDPDWISEDWHMFLKCFLNTGGRVSVVPILLPVINYTPEDASWWGTIWARWTQAKRHALGIAEMVYYLSSLPAAVQVWRQWGPVATRGNQWQPVGTSGNQGGPESPQGVPWEPRTRRGLKAAPPPRRTPAEIAFPDTLPPPLFFFLLPFFSMRTRLQGGGGRVWRRVLPLRTRHSHHLQDVRHPHRHGHLLDLLCLQRAPRLVRRPLRLPPPHPPTAHAAREAEAGLRQGGGARACCPRWGLGGLAPHARGCEAAKPHHRALAPVPPKKLRHGEECFVLTRWVVVR